ncbi:MAG: 6,7-dimethyl-8-ribityllumazine synthase [Mycobacteriales bacterium]|nr:6,7-dimethyl-8-ribityllumazine synthase [Frankia sp.]
MTGSGAPTSSDAVDGRGRRVGVVAARWHSEVVDALLAGALGALAEAGVADADVECVRVPGAFEIALGAQRLAAGGRVDAVVCLGAVVRGGTPHFDYVCHAVADGCLRVSLDTGVPVGFGVLTVDDLEQAWARAGGDEGNKGADAARAALEMVENRS